jgi:hypothetical protein
MGAEENQIDSVDRRITGSRVISPKGATILVEELELSPASRRRLKTHVRSIGGSTLEPMHARPPRSGSQRARL